MFLKAPEQAERLLPASPGRTPVCAAHQTGEAVASGAWQSSTRQPPQAFLANPDPGNRAVLALPYLSFLPKLTLNLRKRDRNCNAWVSSRTRPRGGSGCAKHDGEEQGGRSCPLLEV